MYKHRSLRQIADSVELAASEFYEKFAPTKYKYYADELTVRTLKAICRKHKIPYKAAKKALLQDPIKNHDARSRH